jgi:hypothetical protein
VSVLDVDVRELIDVSVEVLRDSMVDVHIIQSMLLQSYCYGRSYSVDEKQFAVDFQVRRRLRHQDKDERSPVRERWISNRHLRLITLQSCDYQIT